MQKGCQIFYTKRSSWPFSNKCNVPLPFLSINWIIRRDGCSILEPEPSGETIGSRLKKLRNDKNLTLEEISDQTGIWKGNLSDYENDKVKPASKNLRKLANFFGVTVDWLLTGKNPPVEEAYETKANYSCEITFVLTDPENELMESLNVIREVLERGAPKQKAWLEGQIKWDAWKLKNW